MFVIIVWSAVVNSFVGHLHKRVGREEATDDRVVEPCVGVDDLEPVVMLVAGVLVLVHDFFPAAEMVGEDVVEAVGGAVPHKDGHHVATGADVVELACDTARGRHLMEAGHTGHGLLEGVAQVEPRMPPHALRIIVEGETVAVLGDADGKVPEAVGHVAGGGGDGGAVAAPDPGDSMGTAAAVGVGPRGGAGRDVARAVVGDTVHTRAVHRVGDQAVEVVIFECLGHRCGVFPFRSAG